MANPEQKPFDRSVPRRREQDEQEHPGLALGRLTSRAVFYFAAATASLAATSMREATACGCDTYTAWLPLTSTTVEPARLDIARWASGGIILSSVVTKYQLGFVLHAGSLTVPLSAST